MTLCVSPSPPQAKVPLFNVNISQRCSTGLILGLNVVIAMTFWINNTPYVCSINLQDSNQEHDTPL